MQFTFQLAHLFLQKYIYVNSDVISQQINVDFYTLNITFLIHSFIHPGGNKAASILSAGRAIIS